MSSRPAAIGYVLVITAAITFGVNGGMSRVPIEAGLAVGTYTSVRITCAFILYLVIAALFDRPALRLPSGRDLGILAILGVIGVFVLQGAYNLAVVRLPLGIALLLEYLAPVYVVLWVRFVRREPVQARVWPALALALLGLAAVGRLWAGLSLDTLGLAAALIAGLVFAMYFLLGEKISATSAEALSPITVIVWAFGFATVASNLVNPAWKASALGNSASMLGRFSEVSVPAWIPMTYVVVLGTVTPFLCYLAAMQFMPSQRASVVAMAEPVVALIVGWWWFGEVLTTVQVLGVIAVIAGILIAQSARPAPPDPIEPAALAP